MCRTRAGEAASLFCRWSRLATSRSEDVVRVQRVGWRSGRSIEPRDTPTGAQRGCRRRTSECWWIVRAQQLSEFLIRHATAVGPGRGGTIEVRVLVEGSDYELSTCNVTVHVQADPLWRKGRVVFRCPGCLKRATRLYVPVSGRQPRCRRCWGLSSECQIGAPEQAANRRTTAQQSAGNRQPRVLAAAPIRRNQDDVQKHQRPHPRPLAVCGR
jgi:hypothetical protein